MLQMSQKKADRAPEHHAEVGGQNPTAIKKRNIGIRSLATLKHECVNSTLV
jgi:hypothetical protein